MAELTIEAIQVLLKSELQPIKADLTEVKDRVVGLEGRVGNIEGEMSDMNRRLKSVEVKLENDISRNIRLLAEGQTDLSRQIDTVKQAVDEMNPTVVALDLLHRMQGQGPDR